MLKLVHCLQDFFRKLKRYLHFLPTDVFVGSQFHVRRIIAQQPQVIESVE